MREGGGGKREAAPVFVARRASPVSKKQLLEGEEKKGEEGDKEEGSRSAHAINLLRGS